jgi:GNAT superfamily N-acetyltransferase
MALPSNDVLIRPYRPTDVQTIKTIFAAGMLSLHPALYRLFLFRSFVSRAVLVLLIVVRLHFTWNLLWLFALAMSWCLGLWFYTQYMITWYIRESCETDLSDIEGVYLKKGGTFLVATTSMGELMGIVAGEVKDDNRLELRRMSVSHEHQKKGVASKLVGALEEFAKTEGMGTIFLTCTSAQLAAHALYKGNGFMLVNKKSIGLMGFEVYFFEKALD